MITVEKIWLTDNAVWIKTTDGLEGCERFSDYPRLKYATQAQRENFESDAFGIHWPEIDEDLSFEGFFRTKKTNELYEFFMAHPEINASAVARRLGIAQSLLAQYISGTKHPSEERLESIKNEIKKIGAELVAAW
mgnify:FL=1